MRWERRERESRFDDESGVLSTVGGSRDPMEMRLKPRWRTARVVSSSLPRQTTRAPDSRIATTLFHPSSSPDPGTTATLIAVLLFHSNVPFASISSFHPPFDLPTRRTRTSSSSELAKLSLNACVLARRVSRSARMGRGDTGTGVRWVERRERCERRRKRESWSGLVASGADPSGEERCFLCGGGVILLACC